MKEKSTIVLAPAKINLALAVTARRADGYHDLETVFQSVSLYDRLKVTVNSQPGIACSCGELSGEQNLAYKAAQVFLLQCQEEGLPESQAGIRIEIEKNIPWQAGFAGGSSDAAAVLRALNMLSANPFSQETLLKLAKKCGSDAAYCLHGGTQWGEGTGTDLADLPPAPEMDILLVKPSRGVSTKEAFRIFDELGEYSTLNRELWAALLQSKEIRLIGQELTNSLEKAAFKLLPEIRLIKRYLLERGCLGALMSGSGSAVFGIVEDREQGRAIAEFLTQRGFKDNWLVKTVNTI